MTKYQKDKGGVVETLQNPKKETLLQEALNAYGIDLKHVLSSKHYSKTEYAKERVVIVTHGGAKVSFSPGQAVAKLDPIRVDGTIRK